MKIIYNLKSNRNIICLYAPNGGVLFTFDKEIYSDIQIIRGLSIALVKQHSKEFCDLTDDIEFIDETTIIHEVCSECGSQNVEIKAWVSELNGNISKPEEIESEDCWCNQCQKHTMLIQSDDNYILYKSIQK